MSRIVDTPEYQRMTIRSWKTVTVRSLQTDLENQRSQNQRLRHQVSTLERRLSELLGVASLTAELSALPDAQALEAQVEALKQETLDLRDQLAGAEAELAAVCQINRELTAAINGEREHKR